MELQSAPLWYITPAPRMIRVAGLGIGSPEIDLSIQDLPLGRGFQADQNSHQGALAAAAAAHDDENVRPVDVKGQVPHNDKIAISHGEIAHRDVGFFFSHLHCFFASCTDGTCTKSNSQKIAQDGDHRRRKDDTDNGGDHRRGGGITHGRGTAAALHAPHAAGQGHDDPEHEARKQADAQIPETDRRRRLIIVLP